MDDHDGGESCSELAGGSTEAEPSCAAVGGNNGGLLPSTEAEMPVNLSPPRCLAWPPLAPPLQLFRILRAIVLMTLLIPSTRFPSGNSVFCMHVPLRAQVYEGNAGVGECMVLYGEHVIRAFVPPEGHGLPPPAGAPR